MARVRRGARGHKKRKQEKIRTDRRAVRKTTQRRASFNFAQDWLRSRPNISDSHQRWNLKNFSAVSVVASAISSNETPRALAMDSATSRVCAGSHRFPRNGTGARYGQSVSTMNFQRGTLAATSRTFAPFLNVTMPVKETK